MVIADVVREAAANMTEEEEGRKGLRKRATQSADLKVRPDCTYRC